MTCKDGYLFEFVKVFLVAKYIKILVNVPLTYKKHAHSLRDVKLYMSIKFGVLFIHFPHMYVFSLYYIRTILEKKLVSNFLYILLYIFNCLNTCFITPIHQLCFK